jgi:transposase
VADDRQHHRSRPPTRIRRKKGPQDQALGRSRGGNSTKIHASTDALGNPTRFILTGGEKADSEQALPLLGGQRTGAVLADKGYDADYILEAVAAMGSVAVIPPKSNRKIAREYDVHLYKGRNLIERMFGKLKQFRRVATRYDKLASSFLSFVVVAAIFIWLS